MHVCAYATSRRAFRVGGGPGEQAPIPHVFSRCRAGNRRTARVFAESCSGGKTRAWLALCLRTGCSACASGWVLDARGCQSVFPHETEQVRRVWERSITFPQTSQTRAPIPRTLFAPARAAKGLDPTEQRRRGAREDRAEERTAEGRGDGQRSRLSTGRACR
jgi:hypothetical protein